MANSVITVTVRVAGHSNPCCAVLGRRADCLYPAKSAENSPSCESPVCIELLKVRRVTRFFDLLYAITCGHAKCFLLRERVPTS